MDVVIAVLAGVFLPTLFFFILDGQALIVFSLFDK